MNITSRYADIPEVNIDPTNIPEEFRHLLPLAKEWSIGDDVELDAYIAASSEEKRKAFVAAFAPTSMPFGSGIRHVSKACRSRTSLFCSKWRPMRLRPRKACSCKERTERTCANS